ncbi:MAG TPA: nuclear transport factor 2 family protein [Sediminibacterium sp.]|nr:nuclear transport factor 2 family protein [Sediminibacterium sp.]
MHNKIVTVFLLAAFLLAECRNTHQEAEISDAMHRYDQLIEKMDADSIALLYTKDGEMGAVAKGRVAIRKFLQGFKNVHVLHNISIPDTTRLTGDTAIQEGTYRQDVVLPNKDTAHLQGRFLANWRWIPREGWRIQKIQTTPITSQ